MAFSIGVGIAVFERYWSDSNCATCSAWEAGVTDESRVNLDACARSFDEEKASDSVLAGTFSKKNTDLFYTANTDISSIRVVLAEAAQKPDWGISSLDVATAFLNAPMPVEEEETVYVKPPILLEQFRLIKPGIYWKLTKAVYGFRVSPRLRGKERDLQLRKMRFRNKGKS